MVMVVGSAATGCSGGGVEGTGIAVESSWSDSSEVAGMGGMSKSSSGEIGAGVGVKLTGSGAPVGSDGTGAVGLSDGVAVPPFNSAFIKAPKSFDDPFDSKGWMTLSPRLAGRSVENGAVGCGRGVGSVAGATGGAAAG